MFNKMLLLLHQDNKIRKTKMKRKMTEAENVQWDIWTEVEKWTLEEVMNYSQWENVYVGGDVERVIEQLVKHLYDKRYSEDEQNKMEECEGYV
tara:strand:- start:100 stop:378 length:279 start_codon:yes stop_codon:yes gene_type:complete